ncbi:hypothetical protein O181_118326 [Austropuccinia psidii MF-1]|uniref:Tc1-like transposase DDE domain-containing protein n=1 Tax=Austropuccinia psidii MF-1 TaxID=1389203 RepID=A0A9Q3KDP4_9BASI|nr:hypothetical protein [Austropuccinia psidii MF-1]
MEDGTPIHIAMVSQQWHDENQIGKLNWPPNSPDLNKIKNLLFRIKHIVTCPFSPKAMDRLTAAVHASCEDIPFDHLEALLKFLPSRLKMVVDQNGSPTHW